jgi:hypothetical protein
MNNSNMFSDDGHISKWVFFPPAWGGEDYWCQNFSDSEKEQLFSHMKSCHQCQETEIEATLQWAELRPRATRMELIESLETNQSNSKHSNVLPFDEFPEYLLQQILQYTKGRLITLSRDEDGRVIKITGTIDDDIQSECLIMYEESITSIHCCCHNCEDDPISKLNRITFADFHIDFSRQSQITYTSVVTDFFLESKEIRRYHMNHKILTNAQGNITQIFQDHKLWYQAIYDSEFNLTKEVHGSITTAYGYVENKKIFKKTYSDEGLIEHFTFEYAEDTSKPVRIFKLIDNHPQLNQLNTISSPVDDQIHLKLEFDGVTRGYFDHTGELLIKVCLPNCKNNRSLNFDVSNLKEMCGKIDTVDMVLVDTKTKSTRVLKKINGHRNIDQTATYRNGHLVKVFNHKNAIYTSVLRCFFSASDITE